MVLKSFLISLRFWGGDLSPSSPSPIVTPLPLITSWKSRKRRSLVFCGWPKNKQRRVEGPDDHYGLNSDDLELVTQEVMDNFFKSISLDRNERERLEGETRAQMLNKTWHAERWKRLTASSFGRICNLRKSTKKNVANDILFPSFKGSKATDWGNASEKTAISDYEKSSGNCVSPAGLFMDENLPFLAASPDGVLSDGDGLIEIKCP